MNSAAIHLALNVFPPVLNIAALAVFAIGMVWKSQPVLRASLALMLLSALFAIPVFLTGEPAEHLVRDLDGVNRMSIHPHEDAANWAFGVLCVQGAVALGSLIWFRNRDAVKWAVIVTLIVALMATVAVFRTASLGGKIRHPETEMVEG